MTQSASSPPFNGRFARSAMLVAAVALAGALGGCKKVSDITASISDTVTGSSSPQDQAESLGRRYDRNPRDKATALAYARALRQKEQYAQAVAVLQTAAISNPQDMDVLGAYGKALADAGMLKQAAEVLSGAHTPERPNWSILSAQGAVADQLGDHESAQRFYEASLKIAPDDPAVLSNLGLSYALAKDLARAESTLRDAAAQPKADIRVRQNLALVLALQGKFNEAENVSQKDLSPKDAAANVASIRTMIAQSDTWRQIQAMDKRAPAKPQRASARLRPAEAE